MCFASPKPQVDPSRPANYKLNESYGQVTSSQTSPDGVTTGGDTIANTHIKMGTDSKSPKTVAAVDPNGPRTSAPARSDYLRAGANVKM